MTQMQMRTVPVKTIRIETMLPENQVMDILNDIEDQEVLDGVYLYFAIVEQGITPVKHPLWRKISLTARTEIGRIVGLLTE